VQQVKIFSSKVNDPRENPNLENQLNNFLKGNSDKKINGIHTLAEIPGLQGDTREYKVIICILYEANNKIEK